MSADLYLNGDAAADNFTILRSGDSDLIYHNQAATGAPTETVDLSTLGAINIFGNGGADTFTVDYSGGDPIACSLNIYAGGGAVHSTLIVTGVAAGTGSQPQYTFSPGLLTIANSSIDDTIESENVDQFDLFSSGGGSLTVAGGAPTFNQDLGASGGAVNVTVDSGASIAFGVTQHLDNLTIQSGGTAEMLPAGQQVLDTNTLTVDGVLDLADNDLLVNTPDSTDITTLQEQVVAGVTDAASSTGIGTTQGIIYSSTAATDGLTLGVGPAADLSLSTLDGQTVDSTALVARYTARGDVNLDGIVNGPDLLAIAQHYHQTLGTTPPEWYNGDVSYDGVVNASDLSAVSQTYNTTAVTAPAAVTVGTTYTLTLPAPTDGSTATRWDINWGDGTNNSYGEYTTSATHIFTTTGSDLVQFDAVTYDSTNGYGVYRAPAQPLVITAAGVNATPLTLAASASTDTFDISSDDSGNTIITQTTTTGTTTVVDEPTADILSLSITGSAANVLIDLTNGDPLPAAGIFSDAANITFAGPHGTDSLITTGSAAMLGNDTIRFPATTQLADNLTGSGGIIALAGSTTFSSVPATADVTVATGAKLLLNGSQTLNSLTIEPGGTAREISTVTTLGATVLTIGTVTIDDPDAQGDAGGVLDLGNGDLITSNTSLTSVQTWLTAGFDGGLWDGQSTTGGINPAAIVSSAAAADYYKIKSLGYAEVGTADGSLDLSSFDGQVVSTGDVVVALTYYGDGNLDRTVDATDSGTSGSPDVVQTLTGWTTGDFNYDGVVNETDEELATVASNLLNSGVTATPVTIPKGSTSATSNLTNAPGSASSTTPGTVRLFNPKTGGWTIVQNPGFGNGAVGGGGTTVTTPINPRPPAGTYSVGYTFDNGLGSVTITITVQ